MQRFVVPSFVVVVCDCVQCMSCALVLLKKRQKKRRKRQKKRQQKRQKRQKKRQESTQLFCCCLRLCSMHVMCTCTAEKAPEKAPEAPEKAPGKSA
jgi:ABC-type Fe3+ transport system permease subunit